MNPETGTSFSTENKQDIVIAKTKKGEDVECVFTPMSTIKNTTTHVYNFQNSVEFNIPTHGSLNLVINIKKDGWLVPIGVAGTNIENNILKIEMIQRVRAYSKPDVDPNAEIINGIKISVLEESDQLDHPLKQYMQGENYLPWQKILIERCETEAVKENLEKIRLASGFSSMYLGHGLPLSLAISEYDMQVIRDYDWIPYNRNGEQTPDEMVKKIVDVVKKINKGKIKTIEEVVTELGEDNIPAFWEKSLVSKTEPNEVTLFNPRGHQIALQVVKVDNNTVEIQWMNSNLKPTRFSSQGPQSDMYNYIKTKYPDLEKSACAGFFILTDDDGNPTEVGDIGDQKNAAKLIEEQDN